MAPYLNMILKADINRIYDEKYLEAEQAKKEKFFNAPKKNSANSTGKKRRKKPHPYHCLRNISQQILLC